MHAAVANDIFCLFGSFAFLYCLDFARVRGLQQQGCQHHAVTFAGLVGLWPTQHCADGYGGQ
jgi:hypothetical protein